MSTKVITRIIVGSVIVVLIGIIYIVRSDIIDSNNKDAVIPTIMPQQQGKDTSTTSTDRETDNTKTDRLGEIEEDIAVLLKKQEDLEDDVANVSESLTASDEAETDANNILDIKYAKGSTFTTTSTVYTPMSMFVNVTCPQSCTLWVNFFTTSKNNTPDNVNTFGLFLNGADQGVYTQQNFLQANKPASLALNDAIAVSAGTHTVEIQAKTSAGTLTSDVSFLQVMAVGR